ncbi:MAG: site-specific integrase [Intestinimonas massiliensis]|uniref:site-specific integrase n=1 Tax=Intestinimonas massiliensis (ex Afouda et al. 2020) TaxID=1673721 RepID=UPI002431526B|nr:site-specific integrase [Intestinimonas massiliensis (ex Afouda et al. 2020)]MCI5563840.1 site-specific integrase [Intestinimonas massiliensis (ex Afouda et al. 2020)]
MPKAKKRDDGRYMTQIYLGRDETGRKKYKSVYAKSWNELKEKEAEVRSQLGRGLDVLSQRDSFALWADDWLRGKCAASITERQKENYRHSVEIWKERLAGYEIGDVRADDIERVLIGMQEDGFAARTVSFYKSTIRQIMQRAAGRVIPANPVDIVQLTQPGREAESRRALTEEEQKWIWDTPHRAQPVAIIMMLSGLRRGELAALTWNDVDLKAHTITVNKTIEYPPNQIPKLRSITKSAAGMRTVDIPDDLVDYMSKMLKDNVLVIHTVSGKVMTATAWEALWRSYMRLLNIKYGTRTPADLEKMKKPGQRKFDMTIPPITMHWLRHTFCTMMYLAGVDVVQACAQMGHADVTTTLKIYTHLDAIHKRKSVDKLNAYRALQKNGVSHDVSQNA